MLTPKCTPTSHQQVTITITITIDAKTAFPPAKLKAPAPLRIIAATLEGSNDTLRTWSGEIATYHRVTRVEAGLLRTVPVSPIRPRGE